VITNHSKRFIVILTKSYVLVALVILVPVIHATAVSVTHATAHQRMTGRLK